MTAYKLFILLIALGFSIMSQGQNAAWNLNFEEWDISNTSPDLWHDTTIVENRVGLFPPKWHYRSDHIPERTGLARTTDATSGEYAVALSGFYQYQVMRIIAGESDASPGWPIDYRPSMLTGDYKAILLGSCDSLRSYADVYLTKHNSTLGKRDTIGEGHIVLNESEIYKNFELDINYSDASTIPDTVIIVLAKKRFGFDVPPDCLECSHVFFDNIQLPNHLSVKGSIESQFTVHISPNPIESHFSIKFDCFDCQYNIDVINSKGQLIKKFSSVHQQLYIDGKQFSKGLFILKFTDVNTNKFTTKKILVL